MNAISPVPTSRSSLDGPTRAAPPADPREAGSPISAPGSNQVTSSSVEGRSLVGQLARFVFERIQSALPSMAPDPIRDRSPNRDLTRAEQKAINAITVPLILGRRAKPNLPPLAPEDLFGTPRAGSPFFVPGSLGPDKAAQDWARAQLATDHLLFPRALPTDSPFMDRISIAIQHFGIRGVIQRGKLTDDVLRGFADITMRELDAVSFEQRGILSQIVDIGMEHFALNPSMWHKVSMVICEAALDLRSKQGLDMGAMKSILAASSLEGEAEHRMIAKGLSLLPLHSAGLRDAERSFGTREGRRSYVKSSYDRLDNLVTSLRKQSGGDLRPTDVASLKTSVHRAVDQSGTFAANIDARHPAASDPPAIYGIIPLRSGGAAAHAAFENEALAIRDVLDIDPALVREAVAQFLEAAVAFDVRHGGYKHGASSEQLGKAVDRTLAGFERRIDREFGGERPAALQFGGTDHRRELVIRGLETLIHHGIPILQAERGFDEGDVAEAVAAASAWEEGWTASR